MGWGCFDSGSRQAPTPSEGDRVHVEAKYPFPTQEGRRCIRPVASPFTLPTAFQALLSLAGARSPFIVHISLRQLLHPLLRQTLPKALRSLLDPLPSNQQSLPFDSPTHSSPPLQSVLGTTPQSIMRASRRTSDQEQNTRAACSHLLFPLLSARGR